MTATEQKAFEEIIKMLEGEEKVFLVGCGDCATLCQTGGEAEVAEMTQKLQEAGKTVTGSVIPDSTCQVLDSARMMRKHKAELEAADSVLVLCCGAGAQAVAENSGKRTHPGCNSLFLADTVRLGNLFEWCSCCSDCVIDDYGGVCPITRCPKGQVNGPCGGSDEGKCEVDSEQECVWSVIVARFDKVGDKVGIGEKMAPLKNYQVNKHPGKRVFEPRRG
jgi:hypothetical protein